MKKLCSLFVLAAALLVGCETTDEKDDVIQVESVAIDQQDMTLEVDQYTNLTATVLPENAKDRTVVWESSDESVAMVSGSGKVLAVKVGKAVISAKAGKQSDFITVTVVLKTIAVTGVSLDKPDLTINVGETGTLTATIAPEDATNKNVTWSSSDPEIATVDAGAVTGVKPGKVTVTVTTEDGGFTAECAVTVKPNLAPSVTVGADHLSAVSVVLKGKANLESTPSADLMVGFQYSTSSGILPSNLTTVAAKDADADYNYSVGITELKPATTYYYQSVMRQNGVDSFGETKSFTTKPLSSLLETLDADNVSETQARMFAKLDLMDVQYTTVEYGFYWGKSEIDQNTYLECSELSNQNFTASLSNLDWDTQYWYKAVVKLDSQVFYGEVKSFTTKDIDASVETLDARYIQETAASLGGELTVNTTESFDKSIWLLYSDKYTTLAGLISAGTKISFKYSGLGAYRDYLTCLNSNTTYYYVAVSKVYKKVFYGEVKSFTTKAFYYDAEAVDLGLSVLWSSTNLCAGKPENYGAWFAWGEIQSKVDYSWSTYKFGRSESGPFSRYNTNSSYGTVDNKTEFKDYDYEDDAARKILGGKWRIPTDAEWTELRENCTGTWTTQNGVFGRKVTGPNENSIFLPAAGYRGDTSLYGASDNSGSVGYYWSSSLNTDNPRSARSVRFGRGNVYWDSGNRCRGWSVRPVKEVVFSASVETSPVTDVSEKNATLNGKLTINTTRSLPKSVWFLYSATQTTLAGLKSSGIKVSSTLESDGSFSYNLSGLNPGSTYYRVAVAKVYDKEFYGEVKSFMTKGVVPAGAIDLGLSVLWATSNLSASGLCANPQDYGDYYAWGETEPYYEEGHSQDGPCSSWRSRTNPSITGYDWASYKWCNGTYDSLTRYNTSSSCGTVDNKTSFEDYDYADDAARQKLGGKWRTPTDAEWTELRENCTWTWTSNYNGTGVAGRIVTSNVDGYKDKSIFLPAAGYRLDTYLTNAGSYGYYWSSSLNTLYQSDAWDVDFYSGNVFRRNGYRCVGFSVRPVTE